MTAISRRAALVALIVIGGRVLSPASAMDISSEIEAESAIRGAGKAAARIGRIREVPSVGVINLNFPGGSLLVDRDYMDSADFQALAGRYAAGVTRMRRALRANPATRAALSRHHVDVTDVIGVRVSSSGSLRLFVLR